MVIAKMFTEIFMDDPIFLTGGSGFLGTALVHKIITSTQCPRLVLLCRGGISRIHRVWQSTLPPQIAARLCTDSRIHVLDGDICEKNFGLDDDTVAELQTTVRVVMHAASSINLKHSLARLAPIIIQGTLNAAEFAQGCASLDRFVYISTAYANSHLHYLSPSTVPHILESIHPLGNEADLCLDAETEWATLQETGTTPQYKTTPFPFAYAYAKHLTERLLRNRFRVESTVSLISDLSAKSNDSKEPFISVTSLPNCTYSTSSPDPHTPKLLIVRPSIIGPAETSPTPGWQVATSAPVTGLLAFFILTPATRLTFYSALPAPKHDALIDEVPVDTVANRILAHTAAQTSGIVHANREPAACHSFGTYVRSVRKLRRLPWDSRVVWEKDAASEKLCKVSKLYQVSGCTFDFDDGKSRELWDDMDDEERAAFPLFAVEKYGMGIGGSSGGGGGKAGPDLSSRDEAFRQLSGMYFKRKKWPQWMLPLFYNA